MNEYELKAAPEQEPTILMLAMDLCRAIVSGHEIVSGFERLGPDKPMLNEIAKEPAGVREHLLVAIRSQASLNERLLAVSNDIGRL